MKFGRSSTKNTTHDNDARHDDRHHDAVRHDDRREDEYHDEPVAYGHRDRNRDAHERFGGTNLGAAFFGWLVAIGMTILLTSIVGAVATAVGTSVQVNQSEAEQQAGTIGLVAAGILLAIMLIAYYAGGYVAGRMSRFDGGRQGLAVWVIGLLVTLLAVALGVLLGTEYNLLDRVSVPRIPIPTDQLGTGGIIAALIVLVGTALAAVAGGKVGHRYHDKVDRVAYH